jgi:hypothetical protein
MCNSYNHHPSCTCGFGGAGHLGRRGPGISTGNMYSSAYWGGQLITNTFESYVNPNARCPVCNDVVFFYQSPYGGRVFFDELGPPWPKHPCTDNSSVPKQITGITAREEQECAKRSYGWEIEGWMPFFISRVTRVDKTVEKISGQYRNDEMDLFVRKPINRFGEPNPIKVDSLSHLRRIREGVYELSLLDVSANRTFDTSMQAFTSLMTAQRHNKIVGTKKRRTGNRTMGAGGGSAMASAFKNAQQKQRRK